MRLEIGLKLAGESSSRLACLTNGIIDAALNIEGRPLERMIKFARLSKSTDEMRENCRTRFNKKSWNVVNARGSRFN